MIEQLPQACSEFRFSRFATCKPGPGKYCFRFAASNSEYIST